MKKTAILLLCILPSFLSLGGSVYLQNVMKSVQNAEVGITIMRWGKEDANDVIIGQISSDKYKLVTLVFDSLISTGAIRRLTVQTAVHACGDQRERGRRYSDNNRFGSGYSTPNGRLFYCAECQKANAKGAMTTDGCIFKISFPHDSVLRKMRIVDVLADGGSVTYTCKFNISPDLNPTFVKVPVPLRVTIHNAEFSFQDIPRVVEEKISAKGEERNTIPPPVSVVCSECGGSNKCAECRGKGKTSADCPNCKGTGLMLSKPNIDNQFNIALTQTMEILSNMLRDKSTLSVKRQLPIE